MATVKKSKKKIIVLISIVLVIAILAGVIFGVVRSKEGEEVSLYTISTGDISESVSLTGGVTAGAVKEYKVGTVATVKEVFVKVGDEVKKDDLLATFDTENLDAQVKSVSASYNDSLKSYNESVKSQNAAKKKVKALSKDMNNLEKEISRLEKLETTTKKASTKKPTKATTKATTTAKPIELPSFTTTTKPATTKPVTTKPSTTKPTTAEPTTDNTPKFTVDVTIAPSTTYGTVEGIGAYAPNSTATLTAVPNAGYEFVGWYKNYNDFIAGNPASTSKTLVVKVDKDVTYIAYFKLSDNPNNPTTTKPTTSQAEISTIPVSDTIKEMADNLKALNETLATLTNDIATMRALIEVLSTTISEAIASGQLNNEVIAQLVAQDMTVAIQNGIIESANLLVESGVAVEMVETAVKSIDFAGIASAVTNSKNVSLTAAEIQLAATTAQYEIYKAESNGVTVNAQKKALDATKTALDALKSQQKEMQAGWKAAFDGVITALDIVPGEKTNLMSAGMTLENLDKMVVTVSLGEYDVHKVKVGMEADVTTAYGKYKGEIATIAPTATGGSSTSILDSVGSMAGISGLSSLTESGAGVECTITIDEPDEYIIAGFDADVEINTGEYLGVTVVPVESIVLEKTGPSVYLYNEEENTVTKTPIKTGAVSDSAYEVKSGIKVGDKIVAAPSSAYEDETFHVKVKK